MIPGDNDDINFYLFDNKDDNNDDYYFHYHQNEKYSIIGDLDYFHECLDEYYKSIKISEIIIAYLHANDLELSILDSEISSNIGLLEKKIDLALLQNTISKDLLFEKKRYGAMLKFINEKIEKIDNKIIELSKTQKKTLKRPSLIRTFRNEKNENDLNDRISVGSLMGSDKELSKNTNKRSLIKKYIDSEPPIYKPSKNLLAIVGVKSLSMDSAIKLVVKYLLENKLIIEESDKQEYVLADKNLVRLFEGKKKIKFFQIGEIINSNLIKINT